MTHNQETCTRNSHWRECRSIWWKFLVPETFEPIKTHNFGQCIGARFYHPYNKLTIYYDSTSNNHKMTICVYDRNYSNYFNKHKTYTFFAQDKSSNFVRKHKEILLLWLNSLWQLSDYYVQLARQSASLLSRSWHACLSQSHSVVQEEVVREEMQ